MQPGLIESDFDVLRLCPCLPLQHRREDADHRISARKLIVIRGTQSTRPAVDAIRFHDPGRRLGHRIRGEIVLLRSGAVAAYLAVDEPGVDGLAVPPRELELACGLR